MRELLGTKYINDKEAAERYGFSQSWFQHRRYQHLAPKFVKLCGKILYPLSDTDNWFKKNLEQCEQ